jgi:hypothetical protein
MSITVAYCNIVQKTNTVERETDFVRVLISSSSSYCSNCTDSHEETYLPMDVPSCGPVSTAAVAAAAAASDEPVV